LKSKNGPRTKPHIYISNQHFLKTNHHYHGVGMSVLYVKQ